MKQATGQQLQLQLQAPQINEYLLFSLHPFVFTNGVIMLERQPPPLSGAYSIQRLDYRHRGAISCV